MKNQTKKPYHGQCALYYGLLTTSSYPCFIRLQCFQYSFIRLLLCLLANISTKWSRFMALALFDSTLNTPKLLNCSSDIVFLKTALINLSTEKRSRVHMLQCWQVWAILQSLNTSLYGSRKTVSSIKLFGVSRPLICFLSRIRLSWGISYSRSSVLQLYCEANGNTILTAGIQSLYALHYNTALFRKSSLHLREKHINNRNEGTYKKWLIICVGLSLNYWSGNIVPFKPNAWSDLTA